MVTLELATPDPSAYDALPDGVVVAAQDGRVVVLNAAAARMLGTTPAAAVGQDYRDVLPLVIVDPPLRRVNYATMVTAGAQAGLAVVVVQLAGPYRVRPSTAAVLLAVLGPATWPPRCC